tara:strand:+ start:1138 stop:1533 length:396 start_codon:yes stop_codon:yes gene_type:complete
MQNLYLKMNNKITMQLYDVPPAEIRGNSRSHFKVTQQINRKRRETAKFLALDAMHETGIKTLKPRVVVHYHFYNTREIDLDNLIIGMKSTLDGIVDSGLIEDDNPSKLKLEAEFSLCKKEEKKTLITVAEI